MKFMERENRLSADTAHTMAVRAAEGIGSSQDWAAALDYLEQAAEEGFVLAQAELAGLSGNWALAHAILAENSAAQSWWSRFLKSFGLARWLRPRRPQWSGLRNSIDIAKWLSPPCPSAVISEAPRMVILKDVATPEICDWLIARARPRLKRAQVYGYDGKDAKMLFTEERTNSECVFGTQDRDLFIAILRTRIAEAVQIPARTMEPPEVLHYSVGQEFKRHYDSPSDPSAPGIPQRVITLLLSLNEDYEGGETEFPLAGGRWRGRKGTAIYFWNVGPDGARDERSLHGGLPIIRGEKWLMTQFIDRPKQAPDLSLPHAAARQG